MYICKYIHVYMYIFIYTHIYTQVLACLYTILYDLHIFASPIYLACINTNRRSISTTTTSQSFLHNSADVTVSGISTSLKISSSIFLPIWCARIRTCVCICTYGYMYTYIYVLKLIYIHIDVYICIDLYLQVHDIGHGSIWCACVWL